MRLSKLRRTLGLTPLPADWRAQVVHVDLDQPLQDLIVADGYPQVLLVVHVAGAVAGQVFVRAAEQVISAAEQWQAITEHLGAAVWRHRMRSHLGATVDGERAAPRDPTVSVIVCTRDRPDQLRPCLESLLSLRTAPLEIVVVDNAPTDDATQRLCSELPVRYIRERVPGQTRARNRGIVEARGEVVAFTDDDCVVDPRWLDRLGAGFADPLVMAVTGYIGPFELENTAQYLFELHGGFERHQDPRVIDPRTTSPLMGSTRAGAGANMMFRRELFERIGLFAEDLGPGTPARSADDKYAFYLLLSAGYRINYDPSRIVWHRHRSDWAGLRRIMNDYGVAELAYTTRCLVRHGDLEVVRVWRWWARHVRKEAKQALRGRGAIPLSLTASEVSGALRGPLSLMRSQRSRAEIAPIRLPPVGTPAPEPAPRVVVGAEAPAISVSVSSRNRRDMLERVLRGLAGQTYTADRFEVVLVLDDSTDGSAEMARSLDVPYPLRVLEQPVRRGVGAARNRGALEARHPIVLFFDDDIIPLPGLLAEHARAHEASRKQHFALGYYPPVVEGDDLWSLSMRAWWEDHFSRKAQPGHQWTIFDFVDGNASVPRGLFLDTGGYDESFTGRRQDWELAIRLFREGTSFGYYPDAKGWHHLDLSFATGVRNARREGQDDVHLARKHPEIAQRLPLVRLIHDFERRPARTATILRNLERMEPLSPAVMLALGRLEAAGQRRRWQKLARRVIRRSYLLGVLDALPDIEQLRAFLAELPWEVQRAEPMWLDRPTPVRLPTRSGQIDVPIGYGDQELATVAAMHSTGQFDWQLFTEKAVWQVAEPARLAMAFAELERLSAKPINGRRTSNGSGPSHDDD